MSKSDYELDDIVTDPAFRRLHKPKWGMDRQVNGFDTETVDGKIFMVSYAFDGFGGVVESNKEEPLPSSEVWKLLTHTRARGAMNMWYNLSFDANVILGAQMDRKTAAKLAVNKSVETEGHTITYIPGKFLKIEDRNNHTYVHYDASQFFYAPLDTASKEWLGESKAETVEPALFGSLDPEDLADLIRESENVTWDSLSISKGSDWTTDNAWKYIQGNFNAIRGYAIKDAELVRDLWKKAMSVGENLNIPMGKPFSTGYLAQSYLDNYMTYKPGLGPYGMAKLAWDSYAGGRFEILKRGKVGEVVGPDINSAYPFILSNLPDPDTLIWKDLESPGIQEIKEADFGFLDITVSTNPDSTIQPFAHKIDEIVKFPILKGVRKQVVKDIFIHALENGLIEDYTIHKAWLGIDDRSNYPFQFINGLYQERKMYEAQGKEKRGKLLKIILNSMYGKTAQTTVKRRRKDPGENDNLDENEYYVSELSLPKDIRQEYENGFIEWLECGSWFNPFLASYITGLTRLELVDKVMEYGLEDNLIMLATDSVMIEKNAFDRTSFAENEITKGLGSWDLDYTGNAFVIGAGVYEVDMGDELYTKTRGFKEAELNRGLEYEAKHSNPHIKIQQTRPSTVFEAIWSNEPISTVGKFQKQERKISPDMDKKRKWPDTTFQELVSRKENSKPLVFEG